ncbi:MAG: hypothetical protein LBT00_09415 [Spirochaetaceae bacterium]|nr:hypothetical protein [Spirochaetaceae bacterium]
MARAVRTCSKSQQKESTAILAENGGGIEKYANELADHHIYCVPDAANIRSVEGRALLYFDPQSHVSRCAELSAHIERLKAELSGLKRYPKSKLKRFPRTSSSQNTKKTRALIMLSARPALGRCGKTKGIS